MLLAASAWLVNRADQSKPPDWNQDRLTYLPSGEFLKPMAMDLDEAVAALLWVRGMIYFADAYLEGKSYRWMGHILDVVTTLNPYFRPAYEFAGVVLTKEKWELPKTLRLLDRGIETYPKDWKIRLYASLARLEMDSNYTLAAKYLEPIALEKDVPDHIRTLCASLLSKGGGRRMALAFLVNSYVRSENPIHQEIFLEKILKLYERSRPGRDAVRKETLKQVLHEAKVEPMAEMIALGVLHEYLTDSLSQQSRHLLKLLAR